MLARIKGEVFGAKREWKAPTEAVLCTVLIELSYGLNLHPEGKPNI